MAGFSEIGISIEKRFEEKIKNDSKIKTILAKIDEGKADMNDMSEYSRRLGHLARQSIYGVYKEELNDRPKWSDVQYIVENILRQNYDNINELEARVQKNLDSKAGIGLKPLQGDFPAERVSTVIGAASNAENAEQAIRRMCSPTENITASFHADYVKKNAEFRSKAGLNCYVERTTDGKCCDWCSKLAGRYRYPDEVPKDVYRRHDNCTCDVSYVSEKGRQNVHTRQWTNEQAKAQRIEYAASVPKPMKLTRAEAMALESRLIASKPGKNDNAIADMKFINSQAFADKFKGKYENEQVEQAVVKACRQVVKNRNGTFFEEAFFIDAQTGRTVSYVKGKKKNGIEAPEKLKQHLTNAREKSIIIIHNHPNSSPLSRADYLTSSSYRSCYETIAVGHNGDVYSFKGTFETQGELLGRFVEDGVEYPYYEAIRDYRVAYSKHTSRGQDDFQARNSAWEDVSRMRGFIYEKK